MLFLQRNNLTWGRLYFIIAPIWRDLRPQPMKWQRTILVKEIIDLQYEWSMKSSMLYTLLVKSQNRRINFSSANVALSRHLHRKCFCSSSETTPDLWNSTVLFPSDLMGFCFWFWLKPEENWYLFCKTSDFSLLGVLALSDSQLLETSYILIFHTAERWLGGFAALPLIVTVGSFHIEKWM